MRMAPECVLDCNQAAALLSENFNPKIVHAPLQREPPIGLDGIARRSCAEISLNPKAARLRQQTDGSGRFLTEHFAGNLGDAGGEQNRVGSGKAGPQRQPACGFAGAQNIVFAADEDGL